MRIFKFKRLPLSFHTKARTIPVLNKTEVHSWREQYIVSGSPDVVGPLE